MKKVMLVMAMALMSALQVSAQVKVADKELVGTWIMESMQWEGEKKTLCGKESGYTQFKFYGADGEHKGYTVESVVGGGCDIYSDESGHVGYAVDSIFGNGQTIHSDENGYAGYSIDSVTGAGNFGEFDDMF